MEFEKGRGGKKTGLRGGGSIFTIGNWQRGGGGSGGFVAFAKGMQELGWEKLPAKL